MSFFHSILFFVCAIYLIIQVFYLWRLLRSETPDFKAPENYPTISILVAARNEETNILNCLQSLELLDYPQDKIEILIGNDQSTDNTRSIIEGFMKDRPILKCFNLTGNEFPQTKGKARVLAVLAEKAKGDVLLITDADISINPQWAKGMVKALLGSGAGLTAGVTNIKAHSFFTACQQVDWFYFMGIFYTFSHIKKPISAVGNNMAVLRKAYLEVGGYETIPFSITEDYALFKAIRSKGYSTIQLMDKDTLLYSKPIETLRGLLRQRKRWLVGGYDLPVYYRLILFIFGAWYFALPILFFSGYYTATILILIVKDFIQLFQIIHINKKLHLKMENPMAVILYDFYLFIMIPLTALYFFIPGKTVWKGRRY